MQRHSTHMSSWQAISCAGLKCSCARTIVTRFVAHRPMYMHVNMICSSTALLDGHKRSEMSLIDAIAHNYSTKKYSQRD